MKRIPNIILICFSILALTSCRESMRYQYAVTHFNGETDTIIISDDNPRMSRHGWHDLVCECGRTTYAVQVERFKSLGAVSPTKEEIAYQDILIKHLLLAIGASFLLMFLLLAFIKQPRRDHAKPKSSIMKKILKFIVYAGAIVLTFKIVLLLVKYLPGMIESYLK